MINAADGRQILFDRSRSGCYSRFAFPRRICVTTCFRRWLISLLVVTAILPLWADSFYDATPKSETIRLRLVARERSAPISATTRNTDLYLVELQTKAGKQLALLSYSFLAYEPQIPASLFDYARVLKFRAVRDKSCDSTMAEEGKFDLTYSSGAPQTIDPQTALPCYVVTPRDYRGAEQAHQSQ
jgi:hypothetical protein